MSPRKQGFTPPRRLAVLFTRIPTGWYPDLAYEVAKNGSIANLDPPDLDSNNECIVYYELPVLRSRKSTRKEL